MAQPLALPRCGSAAFPLRSPAIYLLLRREAPLRCGVGQQTAVSAHKDDEILVVHRVTEIVRRLFRLAEFRGRALDLVLHRFQDGIARRADWRWRVGGFVARSLRILHSRKLRDEYPACCRA